MKPIPRIDVARCGQDAVNTAFSYQADAVFEDGTRLRAFGRTPEAALLELSVYWRCREYCRIEMLEENGR